MTSTERAINDELGGKRVATAMGRQPQNGAVTKDAPEGPYRNLAGFSSGEWYIVTDVRHGEKVWVIVRNGQQRSQGTPTTSLRDARAWMKDNGFTLGGSTKSIAGFLHAVAVNDTETITKVYGSRLTTWEATTKAAMGESSGSVGGYLLPVEYSDAMLLKMLDFAIIKPRAMVIPMGSAETLCPRVDAETLTNTAGKTSLFGGVQFTWGSEQAPPQTEPLFRQSTMRAWDLLGYAKVSNQWLGDVGPRGDDYLTTIFAGAANWQCEFAYFSGTGGPANMPLGIIPAPATIQVTRAGAAHIVQADVAAMAAALLPYSWMNAIWCCSPTALADVMKCTGYIFNERPYSEGHIAFINGRPLFVTDKLPPLGTLGDIVLFDPSLYAIGERQEVLVERSSEGAGFVTNQTYFRIWYRGDGKPMVHKTIKLQDNSTVVSPYVALL